MVRHSPNGSSTLAYETTPFPTAYATQEWEDETMEAWETPETLGELSPESWETWEMPETQEMQESGMYASPYAAGEWEDETLETWETGGLGEFGELSYGGAMSAEDEAWETPEAWESPETAFYATGETEDEDEDELLGIASRLASRALPVLARAARPMIRRIIPYAQRAVPRVVQSILGGPAPAGIVPGRPRPGMRYRPAPTYRTYPTRPRPGVPTYRTRPNPGVPGVPAYPTYPTRPNPGVPAYPTYPTSPGYRGSPLGGGRAARARSLVRQLSAVLGEADREASALEASLFGVNEAQGELAGNEAAHEAALTEVLAAEAAHTGSESEAAALLGATLPITIRIMGGRRLARGVMPALVTSNARLVSGIYRSGPAGPQLLRTVPGIQRRTVAGMRAIQRTGQPVTPVMVRRLMAANAAKVLGTPRLTSRLLVRNSAVRQGTVAPARGMTRRRY